MRGREKTEVCTSPCGFMSSVLAAVAARIKADMGTLLEIALMWLLCGAAVMAAIHSLLKL